MFSSTGSHLDIPLSESIWGLLEIIHGSEKFVTAFCIYLRGIHLHSPAAQPCPTCTWDTIILVTTICDSPRIETEHPVLYLATLPLVASTAASLFLCFGQWRLVPSYHFRRGARLHRRPSDVVLLLLPVRQRGGLTSISLCDMERVSATLNVSTDGLQVTRRQHPVD